MAHSIKAISQIGMVSDNAERLIAFYRDVLGFAVAFEAGAMTFLRAGATSVMIGAASEPPSISGDVMLYLEPEDWDASEASLEANGVVFEREAQVVQRHEGKEHLLRPFRDPEGRRLYLLGWREAP